MAPKFRGGSDDWIDDERERAGVVRKSRAGAPPAARARDLEPGEANGTVAEVFRKQATVRLDSGKELLCNYRMAALVGKGEKVRERSPVAVGDRVRVEGDVITGLARRANRLVRPAPDREEKILHVIVANIDVLVVVAAAHSPEFSPGLVDRFLVAAGAQGIIPVICVNKVDLLTEVEPRPWELYRRLGIDVIEVSAKRGDRVPELLRILDGKSAAFCGHSGVGKTSLLRALLGAEVGRVGEVSSATGKGRHTTTGAVLLEGHTGSAWIDTPGIREFGLVDVSPAELGSRYPEIAALAPRCRERDCLHLDEAGCAVRDAGLERYASYRRMCESLLAGEH